MLLDLPWLLVAMQFLALLSTSFMCLSLYQHNCVDKKKPLWPDDASIILVPLAMVFLLINRYVDEAITAGALVALTEFVYRHGKISEVARYALWAVALLSSVSALPFEWIINNPPITPLAIASMVLWYALTFIMVKFSGRRAYDFYLLPLYVGMHAFVIWMSPNLSNQLGEDLVMLAAVMLGFAIWRDAGGKLQYGSAMTGFAAVWLGFIWIYMAYEGALPSVLILVAYPLISRIYGKFHRSRQLVDNWLGHAILVVGSVVAAGAAFVTNLDETLPAEQDWMLVTLVYIVTLIAVAINRNPLDDAPKKATKKKAAA